MIFVITQCIFFLLVARRTHVSRVLGTSGGSKPRQKMRQSAGQHNMPLNDMRVSSVSGSMANSNPAFENSFYLPRAELGSVEENHVEQFSTNSGSTAVTIHDIPRLENT